MSINPPITSYIDDFESLQKQMDHFSVAFEQTLIKKRGYIMSSKESHYVKMNELETQENTLKNNIKNINSRISKTKELINKTLEDLQNQQVIVNELNVKYKNLKEEQLSISQEIQELKESIKKLNEAYEKLKLSLSNQVKKDYPELMKYELYLGLKINVMNEDLLRFTFNNVDSNNLDLEVWCDVYVGGESLIIGKSYPELDNDVIKLLQNEYDSHKELVIFLKTVRGLLKEKI